MPVKLKPRGSSVDRLQQAAQRLRTLREALQCDAAVVCLDLEATGPFRDYDRVCEIGAVKVRTDGTFTILATLINPGIPIPKDASATHGITDADVQDAPRFIELARSLANGLSDVVLVGYNLRSFDMPLLTHELSLAGFDIDLHRLPVIDGFSIYQQRFPRDLDAAVKEFCQREREAAHDAGIDVADTIDVVLGQLDRFADLPRDVAALSVYCDRKKPAYIDRAGKFQWRDGVPIVAFTKNAGVPMRDLDAGFYSWILRGDFDPDTKTIALEAANGVFPEHAEKAETEATTASGFLTP
jgi:DNA polymerase-3 subunit epsilon